MPSTRYLLQPPQRVKARFRGCPLPPLSPHPQILQHHIHYKTNHAPINDRQETIHQVPSPASWQKTSPKKHTHQIPIKYPTYLHTSYPKRQSTASQTGHTMRTPPPTQWTPWTFISSNPTNSGNNMDINIEHFCAPIIHPVTGETISNYKKLKKDPATQDIWEMAFGKEFGNMAQGDARTGKKGTNSIFVMSHAEIATILCPSVRHLTLILLFLYQSWNNQRTCRFL